uniref:Dishevelled n=1 Tax=Syphacia muris TaxID=451379 RepID=A0A0N5AQT4_9BILA
MAESGNDISSWNECEKNGCSSLSFSKLSSTLNNSTKTESSEQVDDDEHLPSTSQRCITKVYYYINNETMPYCAILDVPSETVTLGDFKRVFSSTNFRYFCKVPSPDSEISKEVKTEICHDDQLLLRSAKNHFELYLESCDQEDAPRSPDFTLGPSEASEFSNSFDCRKWAHQQCHDFNLLGRVYDTTDSYGCSSYQNFLNAEKYTGRKYCHGHNKVKRCYGCRDSAIGSDTEAKMYSDSGESTSSITDITSVSRQEPLASRRRTTRKRFRKPSQNSFYSSGNENSLSMEVVSVTLNLDVVNSLGITIVGQSSLKGDNGIYVANIIEGGAVAKDGRIESGDMIIQVNDIPLDNLTNDHAVDILKRVVAKRGILTLTIAKMWNSVAERTFPVQRYNDEPVRPIDLNAWIKHTNAMQEQRSNFDKVNIVRMMASPGSGLRRKDHFWLKMLIPNSFLGAELVDWLMEHIEGFDQRKQARQFASDLLAEKLIIHFVDQFALLFYPLVPFI